MVLDKIENASLYYGLGKNFETALRYAQEHDLAALEVGRHDIDGDNVYVSVQEYDSLGLADCKLEGHRTYADIQYVLRGTESIGYVNIKDVTPAIPYDGKNDIEFFSGKATQLKMPAGTFAIVFPHDIHQPKWAWKERTEHIKKVVIKVKL